MKSYLAWPILIKGVIPNFHLTLKYFGDSTYSISDLEALLENHLTVFDDRWATWVPDEFDGSPVLVLSRIDVRLFETQKALGEFRPDDYLLWRPHITVPLSVLKMIVSAGYPPRSQIQEIGPLTLYTRDDEYSWSSRAFNESTRKFDL